MLCLVIRVMEQNPPVWTSFQQHLLWFGGTNSCTVQEHTEVASVFFFSSFALARAFDDSELSCVVNTMEGRDAIQRDLDTLTKWAYKKDKGEWP